jgi:ATP-binding cassette, subfamily B, bacterial
VNATAERQSPYEPTARDGLRLLAGCLRDRPALAALAVLGGLVYQLALIALPWFIERAVDQGIVHEDRSALLRWALVIVGAGILAALAEMVLGWYSTLLATTQGNRLYIALADRVSRLDTRTLAR